MLEMSPELARRMRALDARIAAGSVPKSSHNAIKIATWNIRELGRRPRRPDSLHFIARVIAQFDLVAIVELREKLDDLETIMRILGPTWCVHRAIVITRFAAS